MGWRRGPQVPLKPGNAGYCAASMRATGTASSAIHRRRCTRARQAAPSAICRAVHGLGTPTSNDVRSSTIRSRSPARRKLRRTYTPSSARCRLARVAQPSMQDLVDVLRATGMRKPQGSATEFNRQLNHELALPPISAEIAAAAKTGGVSALSAIRDRAKRAWLGHGTSQLSGIILGTR